MEAKLCAAFKPSSITRIDGLKFILDNGWFLIRPSGTEPKIRLTVEAASSEELEGLKSQLTDTIKSCI
jgi:phosphoglucosamine mutase